jgi:uncharacterized protein (DUF58 family)
LSLLDPGLLQRLDALTLRSKKRGAGVRSGERRSIRRGRSQEFADHRPYVPGDDLRFLDWHLYGRLDALWVKLFEEEEDRVVQLLVDCSTSMEGEKLEYARRLAAAIGFVALGRADRVAVAGLTDTVKHYAPPRRGRSSTHAIFRALEDVHPGGETDLPRALESFPRHRGTGIGLLFSDLLYPTEPEIPLKRLLARNMELHVFHLLSPADIRPALSGDVLLVDAETGEQVPLSVDEEVLDRYEATVHEWAEELEQVCRRMGAGYTRVPTTLPLEDLVLRDLRRDGVLG